MGCLQMSSSACRSHMLSRRSRCSGLVPLHRNRFFGATGDTQITCFYCLVWECFPFIVIFLTRLDFIIPLARLIVTNLHGIQYVLQFPRLEKLFCFVLFFFRVDVWINSRECGIPWFSSLGKQTFLYITYIVCVKCFPHSQTLNWLVCFSVWHHFTFYMSW